MPLTLLLLWLQEKHCKCFNQFSSVTHSCPALCDPMDSSTPGFPVHHQLPEPTQSHVLWVGDVIQPSHPLSSPSPPAFNLSQYQGLFKWVSSAYYQVWILKILIFQLMVLQHLSPKTTIYSIQNSSHSLFILSKATTPVYANTLWMFSHFLSFPHAQELFINY